MLSRRALLARIAVAGLSALCLAAHAQYPERPIKIVVPVSPGGGTDITARLLATHLAPRLGVPVIVENKLGADGLIGADAVAKAAPDGYTLLMPTTGFLLLPFMHKKMPYDTLGDLVGITAVSRAPMLIVATGSLPFRTPKEFGELLRANPDKYSYATFESYGTMLLSMYNARENIQAVKVPYKGSGQAMPDVMSGVVAYMMTSVAAAKPHLESGKLRAVGLTGAERIPQLPEVATLMESGLSDFAIYQRFTLFAPAKTPPVILERIQQAVQAVVRLPEVSSVLRQQGQEPLGNSVAEFQAEVRKEYAMSEKAAKAAGFVPN